MYLCCHRSVGRWVFQQFTQPATSQSGSSEVVRLTVDNFRHVREPRPQQNPHIPADGAQA